MLQFQVIKYGKVVYMKDLLTKVLYESRVMDFYMDMEHFRRLRNEIMHKTFRKDEKIIALSNRGNPVFLCPYE